MIRTSLLCLALLVPIAAEAQTPVAPAGGSVASTEVRGVLKKLFDGMRARDTASMRALMHPSATLLSSSEREGKPTITSDPIDGWLGSIMRGPAGVVLDERLLSETVQIDGGLATVWAEYELWVGDRFSHCGHDAFVLGKTEQGWKILTVADTRRRTGCKGR